MISSIRSTSVGWCVVLAGMALLPLSPSLQAGEAADDGTLDEVVITAQKREESLSDVPLSVEALDGDKIEGAGIMRLDDLKGYVPNLQVTETGIANNIFIRGVGSGLNQGFEQSVSTYADGIYRGRGHQSRMPFFDLARVEVLRGPQPILFGKNAVAGAVNLVSALPGDMNQGEVRGWYDFELKEWVSDVVVAGPLTDAFGARLAVHGRKADGYVNNLTLGRNEPKRDEKAGRLTFRWQPSDSLDAVLKLEGGTFRSDGRQVEIFGEAPSGNAVFSGLTYSQIISGGSLPLIGRPAGLPQGTSASASNNVIDYVRSSQGDSSDLDTRESALTINYDFPSGLRLTSITGQSSYGLAEKCDCDFVGATVFNAGVNEDYSQFSQELRLTSPAGQPFSWIGGLFYQHYDLTESDYLYLPPTSLAIPVLALSVGAANAAVFANAANPRDFTQTSSQTSAFFQGTFKISDRVRLTAGGRYSKEDKTGSRVTSLTAGLGGPVLSAATYPLFSAVLGIVPHSLSGKRSENNFSPLVNLQWDFGEDSMVYLSAARGSKAGGFDARSNKPVVAGGNPTNSGTFEFEDEQATTYEAGLKSRIANKVEIFASVFDTDYKDLQTSAFDGVIGFNVGNGSARIKGIELEGRWQATPALRLTGSLATLDFEWTRYFGQCAFAATALTAAQDPVNAGNCSHAGESNSLSPKMTAVLGAEYTLTVADRARLQFALDAHYSSEYLLALNLDPNATQGSFTKLNGRVELADMDRHWAVALVGRNLTDKTTLSYAGDTPLSKRLFTARSYYGFVDQPRALAIELSYRF
jgi:outer membrane receptor protein involved in Fe transport